MSVAAASARTIIRQKVTAGEISLLAGPVPTPYSSTPDVVLDFTERSDHTRGGIVLIIARETYAGRNQATTKAAKEQINLFRPLWCSVSVEEMAKRLIVSAKAVSVELAKLE